MISIKSIAFIDGQLATEDAERKAYDEAAKAQPPEPATLLSRWNIDPILLSVLATLVVAYAVLAERDRRGALPPWRRTCFYGGWALAAAALF